VHDAAGRVIARLGPASVKGNEPPATYFVYDVIGNLRFERDASGVWTRHEYDQLGRRVGTIESATDDHEPPLTRTSYTAHDDVAMIVDPLGRRTEFAYDGLGRLLSRSQWSADSSVTVPLAGLWYGYDVHGNRISMADADGNTVTVSYDRLNRPVQLMENGQSQLRRYDGLGNLIGQTDVSGAETRYRYDLLGRRTAVMPPRPDGSAPRQPVFDDQQAQLTGIWEVEPGEWQETQQYALTSQPTAPVARWSITQLEPGRRYEIFATWKPDPENVDRAVVQVVADGTTLGESLEVDQRQIAGDVVDRDVSWQRVADVTVPSETIEVILDTPRTEGRLVVDGLWILEVAGNIYRRYDVQGNVIAESDALGHTRTFTYDARSRQTAATDANGGATLFEYDLLGRMASVTDPLGNQTRYEYDLLDQVIAERVIRDGQELVTRYQYDLAGNLLSEVDRLGRVRHIDYDALGRPSEEQWYASLTDAEQQAPAINHLRRRYDAAGRLTVVADHASRYEYTHDDLDRVVATLVDVAAAPPVELTNEYARHDQLRDALYVTIDGQLDHVNRYTYDDRSRLSSVLQAGPAAKDKRVDFDYTPLNQLSEIRRYGDRDATQLVARSDYLFDAQSRLVSLVHGQLDEPLARYDWSRDAAGRIIQEDSSLDGVTYFQYDAAGQLLSAASPFNEEQQLTYDANGNRISDDYVVEDRNLIGSDGRYRYAYDAEGNRVRREEMGTDNVTYYEWDLLNRLVKVTEYEGANRSRTIEYLYDALGRRVGKTVTPSVGPARTERFIYDDQDIVLRFTGAAVANRYLHGPMIDQVLADEQLESGAGEARVLWPLTDHLGTVRDLLEYDAGSGESSVVNHLQYDAFGQVTAESAEAVDHLFGFTGRARDEETGLHYYRARYYDPAVGQFLSEDPAGFAAGDANLRRYVGNDPVNRVDPTGMYGDDVHFYFNYYLARYLGLDQPSGWVNSKGQPVSEALIIAYFATRVDYDDVTRPVGAGRLARERFHLPDPGGRSKGVQQNDPRVNAALRAVGNAGDVEMFGLLLHVYQDSFAHAGLHATEGHFWGHAPDQPYLHMARDRQMAQRVYEQMTNLLLARRGVQGGQASPAAQTLLRGKTFTAFWRQMRNVMLQPSRPVGNLSAQENRVICWQQLIAKDFRNARPRFNDDQSGMTNALMRRFRAISEKVPVWYGKHYSHSDYWGNWKPVWRDQPAPWPTK